jgi:hypothetical protein
MKEGRKEGEKKGKENKGKEKKKCCKFVKRPQIG